LIYQGQRGFLFFLVVDHGQDANDTISHQKNHAEEIAPFSQYIAQSVKVSLPRVHLPKSDLAAYQRINDNHLKGWKE
jgi:hypothetical protein